MKIYPKKGVKRWNYKGKRFNLKPQLIAYLRTIDSIKDGDLIIYTHDDRTHSRFRILLGKRKGIKVITELFYNWEKKPENEKQKGIVNKNNR